MIQEDGADSKSKRYFVFQTRSINVEIQYRFLEKYGANAILGISIAVCKAGYVYEY